MVLIAGGDAGIGEFSLKIKIEDAIAGDVVTRDEVSWIPRESSFGNNRKKTSARDGQRSGLNRL